jgi:hypothetical protein
MNLLDRIEKRKYSWIIGILAVTFFLLRFPSLFEPYWYGDEGIYQVIGSGLRSGRQFYLGVWDNKPPLLFVIYYLANGDQFNARLISLVFGLFSLIAFYFLAKKLFKENYIRITITAIFTLLFGLPIIEGNIANSENFMLLPILVAANLFYPLIDEHALQLLINKKWLLAITGVLFSLTFLIKIVAIFDFTAFLVFIIFVSNLHSKHIRINNIIKNIYLMLPNISWFVGGFIIPVLISIIIFFILGVLPQYLDAVFGSNIDYVGWGNRLIIPQGLLILKILLLILFIVLLFINKNKFSRSSLFILIWLAFSLFNIFFSQRPYTHYLLVLLPSISLYIGILLTRETFRNKIISFTVMFIILYLVLTNFLYWSISRTLAYYSNYLNFITLKKDFRAYQSFFDPQNPQDYMVASYIKEHTHPRDIIFLWGNNVQIYSLSKTFPPGRYSTAYHIATNEQTISETQIAINKNKPKYIIITSYQQNIPIDMSGYLYVLTIGNAQIYERTF